MGVDLHNVNKVNQLLSIEFKSVKLALGPVKFRELQVSSQSLKLYLKHTV